MNVKYEVTKDHTLVECYVDGKHYKTLKVHKDKEGHEYFYVPNFLRKDGDEIVRESFLHKRVGDMVTTIKNGWGDVIEVGHLIVRTEHVIRFLDREYGEPLRKQSLDGWRGTKFAWAVYWRNSMFGDEPLNAHGDLKPILATKADVGADYFQTKFYDSMEEAQAFIDSVISKVKPLIAGLYSIPDDEDHKQEIQEYYDKNISTLTGIASHVAAVCDKKNLEKGFGNLLYAGQIVRKHSTPLSIRTIYVAEMSSGDELYMCKGDAYERAEDDRGEHFVLYESYSPAFVSEGKLMSNVATADEIFRNGMSEVSVYRAEAMEESTSYYLDYNDIFDSEEYKGLVRSAERYNLTIRMVERKLHKQTLYPIIPTEDSPYDMMLSMGKKGLVGRANLRIDETGRFSTKRKFYFPDKSCRDSLCEGMVRVTEVNDRGNYGFIKGSMITYTQPTEEALAEFIMSSGEVQNVIAYTMKFTKHPIWGSAVEFLVDSGKRHEAWVAINDAGVLGSYDILTEYDHIKDEVTETVRMEDFLCKGYTGKTADELRDIVPHVPGLWRYDMAESIKFISEDFDDAVDCGLIDFRRFMNFDVCIMDYEKLYLAASILQDDLVAVLEEAKKINEAAAERFANLKKKKKI